MIDTLKKVWFWISTAALVIFYILYERRGQQIAQLKADAQFALMDKKIQNLTEQSKQSDRDYEEAMKKYEDLKRLYPDLVNSVIGTSKSGNA